MITDQARNDSAYCANIMTGPEKNIVTSQARCRSLVAAIAVRVSEAELNGRTARVEIVRRAISHGLLNHPFLRAIEAELY